jgi:hypothetical protein
MRLWALGVATLAASPRLLVEHIVPDFPRHVKENGRHAFVPMGSVATRTASNLSAKLPSAQSRPVRSR